MQSPGSSNPDQTTREVPNHVQHCTTTSTSNSNSSSNEYTVNGMTCSHCVTSVTEEVSQIEGIDQVEVDLATNYRKRI